MYLDLFVETISVLISYISHLAASSIVCTIVFEVNMRASEWMSDFMEAKSYLQRTDGFRFARYIICG